MPNFAKDDVYSNQPVEQAPVQPYRLRSFDAGAIEAQQPPTWSDYGRTAKLGAYDLAGLAATAWRLAGEEFNLPQAVEGGKAAGATTEETKAGIEAAMSPSAKARMNAAISDPDFYNHMMSSMGLKVTRMTPSIAASVVPATIMAGPISATIAAAGVGAAINTASFTENVFKAVDSTPDEDLQKQSPVYSALRSKMAEPEARRQFDNQIQGLMPVYVFGASFLAGALGPSAQLARKVAGGTAEVAGQTGWRAALASAGEGGLGGGIQAGAAGLGTEQAAVASGAQPEVNQGNVAAQTAEGALIGTVLGAGIGALPSGRRAARSPEEAPVPDIPETTPAPTPTEPAPTATKVENTVAATAQPSTAVPKPRVAQATEHPEVIKPGQPRRRPTPKQVTPEGNIAVANPEAVTATPATGFEKVDASGMDSAVAKALAPDVVPPPPASIEAPRPSEPAPGLQSPPGTPIPPDPNVTLGGAPSRPSAPDGGVGEASVRRARAAQEFNAATQANDPARVEAARQEFVASMRALQAVDPKQYEHFANTPGNKQLFPELSNAPPPGTVPTALGLATEPRPIEGLTAPPTPVGERGSPATVSPVGRVEGLARAPTELPKGPRILEDTRPDVVAQNRLISFQERERLMANQRSIAAEEKAASGEAVGRPLYGKAKIKREADAALAKSIFDKHVPETAAIPTTVSEKAALKARIDTTMEDAKAAGVKVPTNINYEGANPTPDHMVWLREVSDLQKAMNQEKGAPQKQIQQFLIRERAAKAGDFGLMKSERRSEGDIAKRGQQANVETVADTTKLAASKEANAEGVSAPIVHAATAETDAVSTVASATKRGSVRFGDESVGAASEVKKVEVSRLSPEEKARIIAASNRVVAEAAKEAPKPTAEKPVEKVPSKVTPKVESIKQKVAKAAKKVERNPTEAQIEAGNYEKGHVNVQGIPVTIETPAGAVRRGTDSTGRAWESKMPAGTHYGAIKSTRGADGENVDVFMGPHPESDFALVLDQVDPYTKAFDEHKTFVGYQNVREAIDAYVKAFDSKGPERIGSITPMTIKEFKEWLKGDTKKPVDDLAIAKEARDEAAPEGWSEVPPGVELSDSDIRSTGPIIPHTDVRSIETIGAVDALNRFAKAENTKDLTGVLYPFLKRALIKALGTSDVKVHFVTDENFAKLHGGDNPMRAVAFYDPALEHVIVRQGMYRVSPARQAHAIMHELAHAATVGKLDEERLSGRNISQDKNSATYQLMALYLDVKKQVNQRGEDMTDIWGTVTPDQIYGLKNIREFVAEAISNEAFQNVLAKINVSSDIAMFLKLGEHQKVSFWKAIVETVRGILGMPKDTYSALEATLSMSERLIYGSREPMQEARYQTAMGQARVEGMRTATAAEVLARRNVDKMVRDNSAPTAEHLQDNLNKNIDDFIEKRKAGVARSIGDPKFLRMRAMTDMAALAKDYFRGNSVRRVVDAIEAIRVTGGEIAKRAEPVLHALVRAERKYRGTKAFEEMTSLMHDSTMAGVHPDKTLAENTQLGKKSMAGFWGRQQHPELAARYNAMPAELKKIYQDSRTLFEDLHNTAIKQSLENRVLKALGHNDPGLADRIFNDKVTEADKVTLGDDYELVAEAMDFKKVTGPYFPLKRFGNYVVRGQYKMETPSSPHRNVMSGGKVDPNTFEFDTQKEAEAFVASSKLHAALDSIYVDQATGSRYFLDDKGKEVPVLAQDTDAVRRWRVRVQDRHVEFFENRQDAEARRAELVTEGVNMEPVTMRRDDPRMAHGDMLSTHMDRLMHRIEGRDTFKNMPEFQQNEVRRAVEEASYGVLSSTRIQTTRMQRRYVEGASKDIIRSTAEYTGSMAGYLSRYHHQAELDGALREMNKEADKGGEPNTAMGRSQIRNEIMYRVNQPNISPSGSQNRTIDQWRHRLMVTSFVGHLASPAYSLINATQPIMITTPIVGARHGIGSTVAAMARAYTDVAAIRSFTRGVVNTARRAGDQLAETNTYVGDIMSRITNPGERAMMNHLIKHGAIDADAGMEISKLVDKNTGDQWLSYFEGISRQMPLAVESVNRSVSALAAYRLEMKRTGGDHEKSVLYAQEIVESTQGIYANTNMPPLFSSPLASLTFQFKKYGHMIYSLLGQQIGKAIRNANEGDRAEALKALGFIAAAHVTMAGTVGLPTEPIKMLLIGAKLMGLTALTMDDFDEWQREQYSKLVGKTGAEMLTHGLSRGLPGGMAMDLSTRLGMQDFMTFGEPKSSSAGDIYSYVGETVAGAPGGSLVGMITGAGEIANGNVVKGMGQIVPVKVIADAFKAYQLATEGKVSKSGRQVAAPLTLPEAAMRLFGIQPGRIAEQQQAASSYYRNTGRENQQRLGFMNSYATSKGADRAKVWKSIQEWNKGLTPDARLTFSHLTDYVRTRGKETLDNTIGGIKITKQTKAIADRTKALYNQ